LEADEESAEARALDVKARCMMKELQKLVLKDLKNEKDIDQRYLVF
jgi:hypothetical protein